MLAYKKLAFHVVIGFGLCQAKQKCCLFAIDPHTEVLHNSLMHCWFYPADMRKGTDRGKL